MSDAFAPIVRARPNPIFGRPVHQGPPPFDYSPILLLKPFGFRITPDTLSSSEQTRWPTRHYPRLWIQRSSFERRRDFNPPDSCAAQRTLSVSLTSTRSSDPSHLFGLAGPTGLRLNLKGLPCSRCFLWLHAGGTEPREHLRPLALSRPAIPPSPLSDRVGYSDHVRFRGYIPVHFIPAYNLPVYASQRPLPDATQDSVRGCSLGFAAAVIADGRLQRACKAQRSTRTDHPVVESDARRGGYGMTETTETAKRNIIICCDGTGNEISENISNVLKLYRCLRKTGKTEPRQLVFYDPGVGTLARPDPWHKLRQDFNAILGLATGYGLDDKVLQSYQFLVHNYREGDHIYLFGFSRGAYTVRVLAGLIHKVGLISPEQANLAGSGLTSYKQFSSDNQPGAATALPDLTDGGNSGG